MEKRKLHLAGAVMFDGLDIDADIRQGIAIFRGHCLDDIDKILRVSWLGNEEEALGRSLYAVLPVRQIRGPGTSQHGQELPAEPGKAGQIVREGKGRKLVLYHIAQEFLLVGNLLFGFSLSTQSALTRTLLAIPPWVSASAMDL